MTYRFGTGAVRQVVACIALTTWVLPVHAERIKVRHPEGPTHGFIVLSDLADHPLAYGELTQWLEGKVVANRLEIRFDDGSVYDEQLKFSQRPFLRLESYHLVQKGPSFSESSEISFDRTGKYEARTRAAPDGEEKHASGTIEIPEDITNGLTSTVLKNLERGATAKTHIIAFDPEPRILELHLAPVDSDSYSLGKVKGTATRFMMRPRVTGVTGVVATVIGKQPPAFSMWMTNSGLPTLIRFEGPLYADGPIWRIGIAAPHLSSPTKP